jgi:putative addiction module component (TIGR02574 family)
MSEIIQRLKAELAMVSRSDRAELADFLLTTLDPGETDEEVEAAWVHEIERRFQEIRAGRSTARPLEEFVAELRERFP